MAEYEIQNQLDKLRNEIGPEAYLSVSLISGPGPRIANKSICASLYPNGIGATDHPLILYFSSLEEAVIGLRGKWIEYAATHKASQVRKMALAIINITAKRGGCNDLSLRQDGFSMAEITSLGKDACTEADKIASNGPFSIEVTAGANV